MKAQDKLDYWREHLNCEKAVKIQLADEYANAGTKEEINILDEISVLITLYNQKNYPYS